MLSALHSQEQLANQRAERNDTSQHGNWTNFRNETLNGEAIEITHDLLSESPYTGILEFDYVSTTRPPTGAEPISPQDFQTVCDVVGISLRRKTSQHHGRFLVMELQQASCQYYFTTTDLLAMLDCIGNVEDSISVVVVLFSRLLDLYNLSDVLHSLSAEISKGVCYRLGFLNVLNPLTLGMQYEVRLNQVDNLRFVKLLMAISETEIEASPLKTERTSDVTLVQLYELKGYLNASTPHESILDVVARITFKEPTSSAKPNWKCREDNLQHFLLGTKPVPRAVFSVVPQYQEMVKAGYEWKGPVAWCYQMGYLRQKAQTAGARAAPPTRRQSVLLQQQLTMPASPSTGLTGGGL